MIHYASSDTRAGFNLALEQVVMRRTSEPAFWLWRNSRAIIVGRNQNAAAEVDMAEAVRRSVPVYRRASGGGAVYHDLGVCNFTFVLPEAAPVASLLSEFTSLMQFDGLAIERNDVLACGRKIIGTAQQLCCGRRLFHGCLLYDADLALLERLLTPPQDKLHRHGVESVRSRVANLRTLLPAPAPSAGEFLAALRLRAACSFAGPASPFPPELLAAAEELSMALEFRQVES
jgi:lipoate-protein ligase A